MDSKAKNRGFNDYLTNPNIDNPYTKNSFEFNEWLDGWAIGENFPIDANFFPKKCKSCGDALSLPNLFLKWDVCDGCYAVNRLLLL